MVNHALYISYYLDIYCYSCDDAKVDNDLSTHLANWGINVLDQSKTEKSMTELVRKYEAVLGIHLWLISSPLSNWNKT